MEHLVKGLHEFQTTYFSTHREMCDRLFFGQHPRVLFITCSESRINPHPIALSRTGRIIHHAEFGL